MKQLFGVILAAGLLASSTAALAEGRIAQRKENQQARIAQGVSSGSLTPHETAKLERKESALNREIRHDRAANGGTLTPAEKVRVNRQQNRLSRDIYRQKHDAQHQ